MELAQALGKVARGKHGSRDLTMEEAEAVFARLLRADADPLQLGAFLIAERMKGETAAEIAGFVRAARAGMGAEEARVAGAVDLPCYAGKRRAAPAHLIAALRAREAGVAVVIHGVGRIPGRVSAVELACEAGVPRAKTLPEARAMLAGEGLACMALEDVAPHLAGLIALRARIGVRNCAHTVARLLNPLGCEGQLNGFFHTPYGPLMAEANRLLGQPRALLFAGAEGEPELYADRQKSVWMQEGERIRRVRMDDAGAGVYPREACEPEALRADFRRMLAGGLSAREACAVERALAAMRWAAGGQRPSDWRVAPDESETTAKED